MIDTALLSESDRAMREAEFRGFFAGEGCIHLVRYRDQNDPSHWHRYWVRLSVAQRVDNLPTLQWLCDSFGGRIVTYRRDNRAGAWSAVWQVAHKEVVRHLLRVLLEGTLPSTKREQAQLALEFIDTIKIAGTVGCSRPYTTEQRQHREALYERFRSIKPAARKMAMDYERQSA